MLVASAITIRNHSSIWRVLTPLASATSGSTDDSSSSSSRYMSAIRAMLTASGRRSVPARLNCTINYRGIISRPHGGSAPTASVASLRLPPSSPPTSPALGCWRASARKGIRGRDAGDAVHRNTRLQDPILDYRAARLLAWLDGHAEVPVRGPVPCDVWPDRRSWPYTTRAGLWPEEVRGDAGGAG